MPADVRVSPLPGVPADGDYVKIFPSQDVQNRSSNESVGASYEKPHSFTFKRDSTGTCKRHDDGFAIELFRERFVDFAIIL